MRSCMKVEVYLCDTQNLLEIISSCKLLAQISHGLFVCQHFKSHTLQHYLCLWMPVAVGSRSYGFWLVPFRFFFAVVNTTVAALALNFWQTRSRMLAGVATALGNGRSCSLKLIYSVRCVQVGRQGVCVTCRGSVHLCVQIIMCALWCVFNDIKTPYKHNHVWHFLLRLYASAFKHFGRFKCWQIWKICCALINAHWHCAHILAGASFIVRVC